MLEAYLRSKLMEKEILLMSHIVLGYPSLEASFRIVEEMVSAGVDLLELQIPFSEPTADGPVIVRANQKALERGIRVQQCLDFAKEAAQSFNIPFLAMTYFNIVFKYGIERFVSKLSSCGLRGAIIPDLPPEEGREYLGAMEKQELAPIGLLSPTTPPERMKAIASFGKGFIYCVSRKGVTGTHTTFSDELTNYLTICGKWTSLPLALGFGITEKADIDFIKGKADIAVIGSRTINQIEENGISEAGAFIRSLR